jgi:Tripartite tricarboxylate transporter family receptor
VPEFISYAKSNPGKVSYGSGGIGTSIHVPSELFKMMAGIDMIHVPYRGGAPAMTDLMGGQIQVVFNPVPESMERIKAGKLRPLVVTGAMETLRVRANRGHCRHSRNGEVSRCNSVPVHWQFEPPRSEALA